MDPLSAVGNLIQIAMAVKNKQSQLVSLREEGEAFCSVIDIVHQLLVGVHKSLSQQGISTEQKELINKPINGLKKAMMNGQVVIKECTQTSKLKAFIFSGDHLRRLQQAANDIHSHLQTLQTLGIGLQVDTISKISQISSSVSEFSSKIDHRHDELKDLITENSHNTSQRLKALEIMVRSSLVANGKDFQEQAQDIADHAEEIRNAKGFNDTRMLEWAIQMSKIPESIICPISHDVMEDPVVVVQSGITYDHSSLCKSLLEYPDLDPKTSTHFNTMITFIPNVSIRQILMQHFGDQAYKKYESEGEFQSQYRKAWAEKILGQDEEIATTLYDETNDSGETNDNGETKDNDGTKDDEPDVVEHPFWKKKWFLFLLAAGVLVILVVVIIAVVAGGSGNGGGDTSNILKSSSSTEASDTPSARPSTSVVPTPQPSPPPISPTAEPPPPTESPMAAPFVGPIGGPPLPTEVPSEPPSTAPFVAPSSIPYSSISSAPFFDPSSAPSFGPSSAPSFGPIVSTTKIQWKQSPSIRSTGDEFGRAVKLSEDGKMLVVGGNGIVRTYDANSANEWVERKFQSLPAPAGRQDFGRAIDLSADGFFMAVAAKGTVGVYVDLNGSWKLVGNEIGLTVSSSRIGVDVSLAKDTANVVAVAIDEVQVKVYELLDSNNTWISRGDALNGDVRWGTTVALSGDGSILAFGDPTATRLGTSQGRVRVYEWNGSKWTQRGGNLWGPDSPDSRFGRSAALSRDGRVVVGGANFFSLRGTNDNIGVVQAYEWDGTEWALLGEPLFGRVHPQGFQEEFGRALSVSADGTSIAVAAPYYDTNSTTLVQGAVEVYGWNPTTKKWIQRGQSLFGAGVDTFTPFGYSISLSGDSNTIAVGKSNADDLFNGRRRLQAVDAYVNVYNAVRL